MNLHDENVQRVKFAWENVEFEKSQFENATSDAMARSKSQPTNEHPSTRDSVSSTREKSAPSAASPRTRTWDTRRSPPLSRSIQPARSSTSVSSPGIRDGPDEAAGYRRIGVRTRSCGVPFFARPVYRSARELASASASLHRLSNQRRHDGHRRGEQAHRGQRNSPRHVGTPRF